MCLEYYKPSYEDILRHINAHHYTDIPRVIARHYSDTNMTRENLL